MDETNRSPHEGHRLRLRQRFITDGNLNSFQDHNILELLLFYTIPRADTNELAHALIDAFGSIKAVFDAPYEALMAVPGVGERTAVLIKLVPSLAKSYYAGEGEHVLLTSSREAAEFFRPVFLGMDTETIAVACLNGGNRVIRRFNHSYGGVDFSEIDAKSIMAAALNCNAAAVVLAHNHPSGICAPSRADHIVTTQMAKALASVNVKFLNHLIISAEDYFSFADHPKFADCFYHGEAWIPRNTKGEGEKF